MALAIYQNILWLEISIYDSVGMQALKCQNNFSGIEPGSILVKALAFLQVKEEFASIYIIHHEI